MFNVSTQKQEDMAKRLGVDKKEEDFTTGREMRSKRERNLKVVFNTQPEQVRMAHIHIA